jgi:hypothetical protein
MRSPVTYGRLVTAFASVGIVFVLFQLLSVCFAPAAFLADPVMCPKEVYRQNSLDPYNTQRPRPRPRCAFTFFFLLTSI